MTPKSPLKRIVRLVSEVVTLAAFPTYFIQRVAGWGWGIAVGAGAILVQMFYRRHDLAAAWRERRSPL